MRLRWTRYAGGAALLQAALLLAACGGGDPAPQTGTPEAPAASAEPKKVETPHGVIDVPANPQRIVTLHTYTLNALLDVGITPVGTVDVNGSTTLPEYVTTMESVPRVGNGAELKYEDLVET